MIRNSICVGVILVGCALASAVANAAEPAVIPLWPDGGVGPIREGLDELPSITVYLPEAGTGVGIVVCPGGGYGGLALDHEGQQVAEWLNDNGIAAFVLRYRHGASNPHPAPLRDVLRAIRLVRSRGDGFEVDTSKIGVLGFSAGGHLTASSGVHFNTAEANGTTSDDPMAEVSARPDFIAPIYPVIDMSGPYTHQGSRKNLLGNAEGEPEALNALMTLFEHVTSETPPTFIAFTTEDQAVPVENGVEFYLALRRAGVPAEMHVFEQGRHGLGLGGDNAAFSAWPGLFIQWLHTRGLLE